MLGRLDLRGLSGADLVAGLPRPAGPGQLPLDAVRSIIAEVRSGGDAALLDLTSRFDKVRIDSVRVAQSAISSAPGRIGSDVRAALEAAHEAISDYHRHTLLPLPPYERDGVRVVELRRPVQRAGCYVPGGRARYPSSVLMTAVPALVAGVEQVALCVPPGPDGEVDDVTLAAADIAGVDEVYRVGGAQAIAALAYGTESVPRVDVIVGPGNLFVSLAQKEVAGVVGVPSAFAGPSEVVVIADSTSPLQDVAVDLVVQAEHGPNGLAWLLTWSEGVAEEVTRLVEEVVSTSPRAAEVRSTLESGGYAVVVDGPEQAMKVSDEIAPEHLELMCSDPEALLPMVHRAGAVFCGPFAPASVGDYLAGPSHVLPTHGTARFSNGLSVNDFLTKPHVISVTSAALARVGPHVVSLARSEGLDAHARSVSDRLAEMSKRALP